MSQRKILLSMSTTLDGFVAGPNGEADWMQVSPEIWSSLQKDLDEADTFLLGRKMYPEYSTYWQSVLKNPASGADELRFARLAEKTQHIVFTKSDFQPDWKNTRVSHDPEKEIADLKQQSGKNIIAWGGASFASALIKLKLVDEMRLAVNPVIIGSGKSLFSNLEHRNDLELIGTEPLQMGVVVLRYKLKK